MSFNEYENVSSAIRTVDQLLGELQDLNKAVNDYRWANEKQGEFIRNVYERLGIFQDDDDDEGVNVDACFNKALTELDNRLSYFEGTSRKAIARSDRYAEWLDDIEAELFGERIETFTHGDHERQSERMGDILGALENGAERLMPEGMEWPRFEDGEPVRPGDRLLDKGGDWFKAVSFVFTCDWWSVRGYQTEGFGDLNDKTRRKLEGMAYGTCVKRPAPKVLAADGEPLEAGQTVYLPDGMPVHVTAIGDMKAGQETVFGKAGNDITDSEWQAVLLTHQRPDSWERLEEDAKIGRCAYNKGNGYPACCIGCDGKPFDESCIEIMARDLVRRAKALAERWQ